MFHDRALPEPRQDTIGYCERCGCRIVTDAPFAMRLDGTLRCHAHRPTLRAQLAELLMAIADDGHQIWTDIDLTLDAFVDVDALLSRVLGRRTPLFPNSSLLIALAASLEGTPSRKAWARVLGAQFDVLDAIDLSAQAIRSARG